MAIPWALIGGGLSLLGSLFQPRPQAPKPQQYYLPGQEELYKLLADYTKQGLTSPPAAYQGPLTAGPTASWQQAASAITGRSGTGLTSTEDYIQQLVNQRLQPGYNAMSSEVEEALWGRGKDRLTQYYDEARNRLAQDYAKRGLYQSGLLSGAQLKLGEQEGQQYRELARDVALRGSEMTREDVANAMNAGVTLGNIQRQYADTGLSWLWNLAQAEQGQAQAGVQAQYAEWIRQQQAQQQAYQNALSALGNILGPQAQQGYQNAYNAYLQQLQQSQAGAQNWGTIGGYLLAPYYQNWYNSLVNPAAQAGFAIPGLNLSLS